MKINFEFKERHHIFYMYNAAAKALNLNREMRRKLMKTAGKFNTEADIIDLKPKEVILTMNLLTTNLSAYGRILTAPFIEDEIIKTQFEEAHLSLSNVLDKLQKLIVKGKSKNDRTKKRSDDTVQDSDSRKKQ